MALPTLLGDRVLLELPRNYGLDLGDNLRTAKVLAVGPGGGSTAARVGDVVAFHASDALRLALADAAYLVVKRSDLAAVVAAAPAPAPAPPSSPSRK